MLEIQQSDIKDYLDWLKIQISISSAVIGAIALKTDGITTPLKWASILFLISIILFLVGFSGLVEHKNSKKSSTSYKASIPVILGHFIFGLALIALVSNVF